MMIYKFGSKINHFLAFLVDDGILSSISMYFCGTWYRLVSASSIYAMNFPWTTQKLVSLEPAMSLRTVLLAAHFLQRYYANSSRSIANSSIVFPKFPT